jgi:hypothetical protein
MTIQTLFGPEKIPTKQRCMIGHCPLSLFIKDKGCPPGKTSLYSMGLLTGNHSYSSSAPTVPPPAIVQVSIKLYDL